MKIVTVIFSLSVILSLPASVHGQERMLVDSSDIHRNTFINDSYASILSSGITNSMGITMDWIRSWGSSNIDAHDIPTAIFKDAEENIYIGGYSTISPTGLGALTLKYDSSGSLLWKNLNKDNFRDERYTYSILTDLSVNDNGDV